MRTALAAAAFAALIVSGTPALGGTDEAFTASVSRIDRETRRTMVGTSWHPGCPVPLANLRLLRVTHWGFDDTAHEGELVVHRGWADEIVSVFRALYRERFPVRRMRLVDQYGADDRVSMKHDNTSAFNCRFVAGTSTWSQHAFGRAIDINPVENPYVAGSHVSPPRGRRFIDRTDVRPGMIVEGDAVWQAFRRIGWGWGGSWSSASDYQHFSANGR